jgi:hypothetical protein
MKKYFCLAIIILFSCLNITGIKASTTKIIRNCIDLQNIQNDLGASYVLVNNIDCSDTINWNGSAGFAPIGTVGNKFTGSLVGRNHSISNLYFNDPAQNNIGLFAYIENAHLKNINFIDTTLTGQNNVALITNANNSTLENITIFNTDIQANEYTAPFIANLSGASSICKNITVKNCNINILNGHATGFITIINDVQNVYNIIIDTVDIINNSNDAYDIAGALSYASNSHIKDLYLKNVSITTDSTIGNGVTGAISSIDSQSRVENLYATNINIDSQDFVAGLINQVSDSTVYNSNISEVEISADDDVAGVFKNIDNNSIIQNITAEHITINAGERSSGFIRSLTNNSQLTNSHLSNLDLVSSAGGISGFIRYMDNSSITGCSLTDSRIFSDANNASYNGGFILGAYNLCTIENSYIDNLQMLIRDGRYSALFAQHIETNITIDSCYVVNSLLDANETGDLSVFIDTANGTNTINNSYASAQLIYASIFGNYSFVQNPSPNTNTSNCYYNRELIPDFPPNFATALNTADFADFTNTTTLDPNIWYLSTDNFPALKSTEVEIGNEEYKILPPKFTSFYDRLSKGTLVTDLSLSNNLNNFDFTFEILNSTDSANLFYIRGQKLYTNKVFYYNQGNQYHINIKAINSNKQFLTKALSLRVLKNPSFWQNKSGEKTDDNFSEESDTIPEDICESEIKSYLNFSKEHTISNFDLVNLILDLQDISSPRKGDVNIAELLSCDSIAPRIDNIKKELDLLGLNKRNRLNFKAYRKYVKKFKRLLKKDSPLTCENLKFDHDTNCVLDINDFQFYKSYFKSSIERRVSSLATKRKLDRIDLNFKLRRLL